MHHIRRCILRQWALTYMYRDYGKILCQAGSAHDVRLCPTMFCYLHAPSTVSKLHRKASNPRFHGYKYQIRVIVPKEEINVQLRIVSIKYHFQRLW